MIFKFKKILILVLIISCDLSGMNQEYNLDHEQLSVEQQLMQAVEDKNIEIVKKLYDSNHNKINLNYRDKKGNTAFILAVKLQCVEIADFIASKVFESNNLNLFEANNKKINALMYASNYGNFNIIQVIADHSFNTENEYDKQDNKGWTALFYAANNGNMDIVDYLLNVMGLDRNITDKKGRDFTYYVSEKHRDRLEEILDCFKKNEKQMAHGKYIFLSRKHSLERRLLNNN